MRQLTDDPEAAEVALFVTHLNWGVHAWAIYGVVGLSGSLAMGVFQIQTGLAGSFRPESSSLFAPVFVAICVVFVIPLRRDLGDGMTKLSTLAMLIAIGLMVFLLIVGPTSYIMNSIVSGFGRYVFNVGLAEF